MGEQQHSHTLTRTGLSPSTAPPSRRLQLHAWFLTVRTAGRRYKMLPTTPHTQPLPGITCIRFGLIRFRSPLLSESLLFSLPVGTEMFHFPTFPPHTLYIQARVTGHDSSQVSPFGHPRITARLPTPQGLSQAPTSFIGSRCQGIHHVPFIACHNTHTTNGTQSKPHHQCERTKHHTTPANPHPTPTGSTEDPRRVRGTTNCYKDARVHYGNLKQHTPTPPTTPHPADRPEAQAPNNQPPLPARRAHLILQNPNSVPLTYSPTPGPRRDPAALQAPPSRGTREDPPHSPTHRTRPHRGDRRAGVDGSTSKQPRPARTNAAPRPGEHHPTARPVRDRDAPGGRAVDCSLERR